MLEKFCVHGGTPLSGTVRVHGSKNAALPILYSVLLTRGRTVLENVPPLRDVTSTLELLSTLGVKWERRPDGALELEVLREDGFEAPYDLVRKMRASIYALGPLLAKRGRARVSRPGGCNIGVRPIDLHLKGMLALGAEIRNEGGYVCAEAPHLTGRRIYLGGASGSTVSGTANVMMAAALARGTTVIEHAACEPEIADLARYLNACGAGIRGAGTPVVAIEGVSELRGCKYRVMPDRIEAGTFMIGAALTAGEVRVEGARFEHLAALIDALESAGACLQIEDDAVQVSSDGDFRPVDVTALPYPGFPTDLQSQITVLLSLANGISVVTEKIYPDRFIHVAELNRLGANVRKEGSLAIIHGVKRLSGAPVMASDLRASACLILAGLVANGMTEINRVYHIDRGYHRIEESLKGLGAQIERVPVEADSALLSLVPDASPELRERLGEYLQIAAAP
ncbi:MAG TPA: UDP-N-acetylglucosamine 1-carboxyvinyltransferase [Planctomycetota bacterium]|nr:UDP-N-acetylglucosamine 1-carboxyvinyltransferase [Planctomycetota bacterium]OQC22381.1 MAG: UDP-N-acetylglucosamine 1-carboxyvinyltransferase [Planctomycetes bacterium ADurb.Bin069]NMD35457.1 UDP-N-acetylglucosamine 1-carboxyvinyltransferase [Planctomycetota bacterium]HNR98844.1 UDP-N-acetylglucosamine 1-carboxyvinyltransferase [Planctomycetota bacterium]HNU26671.1 UDP-N-acetylglucosamine 1-carboxyvinyltransferase [Planctomycetota bacterium]